MLFRTSSVHGIGMREPLWAVGLDAEMTVIAVRRLDPGRIVWIRGARWILEMPIDQEPPAVGEPVRPSAGTGHGAGSTGPGETEGRGA